MDRGESVLLIKSLVCSAVTCSRVVRPGTSNLWLISRYWTALELYRSKTYDAIPPACLPTKLIHKLSKGNVLGVHSYRLLWHAGKWASSVRRLRSELLSINLAHLRTQSFRRAQQGHVHDIDLSETHVERIRTMQSPELRVEDDPRHTRAPAEDQGSESE